jgi:hypothetical protein
MPDAWEWQQDLEDQNQDEDEDQDVEPNAWEELYTFVYCQKDSAGVWAGRDEDYSVIQECPQENQYNGEECKEGATG